MLCSMRENPMRINWSRGDEGFTRCNILQITSHHSDLPLDMNPSLQQTASFLYLLHAPSFSPFCNIQSLDLQLSQDHLDGFWWTVAGVVWAAQHPLSVTILHHNTLTFQTLYPRDRTHYFHPPSIKEPMRPVRFIWGLKSDRPIHRCHWSLCEGIHGRALLHVSLQLSDALSNSCTSLLSFTQSTWSI